MRHPTKSVSRKRSANFRDTTKTLQYCLPRISFTFNAAGSSWTVNRKQFPLRSAYATTFNGSRGLTLQKAVLDLRTDSFAHGQLYTALRS
ncbi:hypothetical protein BDR06DRAFT_965469 [Suillus hirtellus]|nr:hypothetical protein BDR06DRAFT_965469 [Suillus hirtellus]